MDDTWSEEEVVKLYKGARNKVEEIMILADLTDSDEDTILKILEKHKLIKPTPKICSSCGEEFYTATSRNSICPKCERRIEKIDILEKEIKQMNTEIQSIIRKQGAKRNRINKIKMAMKSK